MTRIPLSFRICLVAAVTAFVPAAACASPFGSEQTIAGVAMPEEGAGSPTARAEQDGQAPYKLAQADCADAAAEAAAQTGGQVLSVSSRSEGGRIVCEVTVLVPARDGERPRKTTITIRQ